MSDIESLKGVRVQVIDDSRTIRKTAETILSKVGCDVCMSEDGYTALSHLVEFNPQIIFIDVIMPRLDGYKTCSLIKRNDQFADVPVVMLSSKDGLFDRAKGRMAGSEEYLTKPFTKDELIGAIKKHLSL